MENRLKSEKKYIYKISHKFIKGDDVFVEGNIEPETLGDLIFYLELQFHNNYLEEATLTHIDIEDILVKFYDFKSLDSINKVDVEIDMYTNYEKKVVKADEIYYSDKFLVNGIEDYLRDIMIDIVYTNPVTFKEKFLELIIEQNGVAYISVPKRIMEEIKDEN